jgi:CubicO group peptidase (beta-lactamase class C family)
MKKVTIRRRANLLGVALVSILFVSSCSNSNSSSNDNSSVASEELAWPTAGWAIETPESHGLSSPALEGARDYAFQVGKNTQGVVVVRHGVIVAEWYALGRDENSFATSWSMGKSFTSALIGIAIDEGLIEGVDVNMAEFLPHWRDTPREDITLRDVLSMASGIDWNEAVNPQSGLTNIVQMLVSEADHLAYASSLPLAHEPGTHFNYSSGDTMLLSGVLEGATGMTAGEFATAKIFEPLGMAPVQWWRDAAGHTTTYCCIDTTTRQFAKFGLLYARGGNWDGQQIVSQQWVAESIRANSVVKKYGYQWWLNRSPPEIPGGLFAARGRDGQYMYVAPGLDLVVVRNGIYDKYDGEPVADPSLWALLPSDGFVKGLGTVPPDDWDHEAFMTLILDAMIE